MNMASTQRQSGTAAPSSSPGWAWSPRSAPARIRQLGKAHCRPVRHPAPSRRFPTDGLKTRSPAPSISFRRALSSADCRERLAELAADEAVGESGIGRQGDFPGPLFLAVPPIEMEWPQRLEARANVRRQRQRRLTPTCCARDDGKFPDYHRPFLFGSVADQLADQFGTKGSPVSLSTACASGATAIQLGVEAIRRGETDAALCVGADGSVNPEVAGAILAAVGAVHP